ncbi:MAG TPA: hypothetical protein VNZ64_27965 [Candidatus Acidoferrum sp.]|jgi:hypothetical protein|nr:hypothetical protein [Candidatus Acidoferrum sp.]
MAVSTAALMATSAAPARADESAPAAKPDKRCTGIISSVDPAEHVVTVKEFLQNRRFNLGNTCTYTFPDQNTGTAADLRPGQKVTVCYLSAQGVLVADQITQEPMRFVGTVAAVEPATHRLIMRRSLLDKTFQLGSDCAVVLRNDKTGALTDVQPGERVTVTYETPHGTHVARQIAQTSATFTGTLTALDMSERTIKAKTLLGTKKFNLANGCAIVVNGKLNGRMNDLKPGETLTISYDDLNGVSVANRLAAPSSAPATVTAQAQR